MNLINTIRVGLVKTLIKALTIFSIYTYYTFAQVNVPIIVSPFIGEKLDRVERNYFGLFPHIEGFEEATFYLNPDSSLAAKIFYKAGSGLKDTLIERYKTLRSLNNHINLFVSGAMKNVEESGKGKTINVLSTDSVTVSGELIQVRSNSLQLYNPDYKTMGLSEIGKFGFHNIDYSDTKEIKLADSFNLAIYTYPFVGALIGYLIGVELREGNASWGNSFALVYGVGLIGSLIGSLLAYVLPLNIETEIIIKPPFDIDDFEELRNNTRNIDYVPYFLLQENN